MSARRLLLSRCGVVVVRNVKSEYNRRFSTTALSSFYSEDKTDHSYYQPVSGFYEGKSVFITGGTGFLGKVFIEKLLDSCSKLDKIYILVRDKKGQKVNERMKSVFDNPLFSKIKETNPKLLEKVVQVTGDLMSPNFGLKPEDEQALIDNVSVVFHAGATVKFNEPLPVAMRVNFEGTRTILNLCQRMKNVEAFVYISTAFAHVDKKILMETIYPAQKTVEEVYKFIERNGGDKKETEKFISPKPNTYTFTKALSEAYIAKNHGKVPAVIVRPSAVTSVKDGHAKGWVDNWFGITPLMYDAAKGWNRVVRVHGHSCVEIIPVDYVSNLSVIAASRAKDSREVKVFNSISTDENPITWVETYKYFIDEAVKNGKNDLPYPSVFFTKSRAIVHAWSILCQITPAHAADWWLKMTGREPRYAKLMYKVIATRNSLDYFTSGIWPMRSERARQLISTLSAEDQEKFPCDPSQIVWPEYMKDYCNGVFRYLKARDEFGDNTILWDFGAGLMIELEGSHGNAISQ